MRRATFLFSLSLLAPSVLTGQATAENQSFPESESAAGAAGENAPAPLSTSADQPASPAVASDSGPRPQYAPFPLDENGRPRPLSLQDTIRLVLDNNNVLRIRQLEILKSDTDLLKDDARYAPVLEAGYQSQDTINRRTPGYLSTGSEFSTDIVYARLKTLFVTGTYFELGASDTRFESNRNSGTVLDQITGGGGDPLRPSRPLHTGALTFVLQQELLRNSFGYAQRRLNDIYRNRAQIDRETLQYDLTRLVVQTLVNYWSLSIAEENLRTADELLRNTRNIRTITAQKRNIGLAEAFEVNQWNALVAGAELRLDQARLERNNKRRELLRNLNLDPELELSGATQLPSNPPQEMSVDADLLQAYNTRPDFRSIRLQMENARRAAEIADNQLLPSVSVGGSYSSRDYGRHAQTSWNEVSNGRYPDYSVQFKVEYPLWNESAEVDVRNAHISLRQLSLQEEELRRQIHDEVLQGQEAIRTAYSGLQKARLAVEETNRFYQGLVARYRQGRFTAVAVKEALDALVQARQGGTEALINYNISLLRYELTRNTVFHTYEIDIDETLNRALIEASSYEAPAAAPESP
ncbi:MAG: TolC family protein [Leptospirales bacterium]|nr:TolC family protein [Leptospirales bacterium]